MLSDSQCPSYFVMATSSSTDAEVGLSRMKTLVDTVAIDTQAELGPKRLRLWIFCCLAFIVIAPTVSTIIGIKIHAGQLSFDGSQQASYSGRTVRIRTLLNSRVLNNLSRSHSKRFSSQLIQRLEL